MTIAAINRLIQLFDQAFRDLGCQVGMPRVEKLAMLVQHSMDHRRRVYHTSRHLFELAPGMNARQTLAILFHDLVYYQLDGGLPPQLDKHLRRVVRIDGDTLILRSLDPADPLLQWCATLFDFSHGQTLSPYSGQNEFLSAVAAAHLLHKDLRPADLLAVLACIEATIPFRGCDREGRSMPEGLRLRLQRVNEQFDLNLDAEQLDTLVGDAVDMANRDVAGFAEPDPARFLGNTWQLIEESNAPQVAAGTYSIQEYRSALARMEGFLGALRCEHIFHAYAGHPDTATLSALTAAAERNLIFACNYLGTKLLSIGIVEALALLTGGNCPVSMFLGDIRIPGERPDRVEDFLPPLPASDDLDSTLLQVLRHGRAGEATSDLNSSPLSAYVYEVLGQRACNDALETLRQMFAGKVSPADFLATLPRPLLAAIAQACARIALSRRDALIALITD